MASGDCQLVFGKVGEGLQHCGENDEARRSAGRYAGC